MSEIKIKNLTKDYGEGRGIFDINLNIEKGECFGFVGTNGSGKTTTIRNIMGFLKPTSGTVLVKGLDSYRDAENIKKYVGYIPGEIAFPDLKTGVEFLKNQAEFLGLSDMTFADEITKRLQLDPSANLKRMSKGMKQKTAIVASMMNDPEILIFDEPTTGLDPLMRLAFLDLILMEKEKGKTIFMSSHSFDELEKTCDRVALIKDGKIIDIANMDEIKNRPLKDFKIEFNNVNSFKLFKNKKYNIIREQKEYNQVTISIKKTDINKLFNDISNLDIKFISEVKYTLEKHFKQILKKEKENDK